MSPVREDEGGEHLVEVADDVAHLAVEGLHRVRDGGPAVDQLVDLGRVALEGARDVLDELVGLGRVDGVEHRVRASSGTCRCWRRSHRGRAGWWSRPAAAGRTGPGNSSISFCPMTLCQRMPTSVDRRSATVLLTLMATSGVAVLHADAGDLADRHAGDVDRVARGQPGDVAQLRVDGVAAAEERDVADPHGQADQEDEADQREDGELEGGPGQGAGILIASRPPEQRVEDAAEAGRLRGVGLADGPVGLVGRGAGGRVRRRGGRRGARAGRAGRRPGCSGATSPGCALKVASSRGAVEGRAGTGQRLLDRLEERHAARSGAR